MPGKEDELGGLWLKTSERTGKKFMSGRLTFGGESVEVVVFKNDHKQPGERTPDYRVYRSQPRDAAPAPLPSGKPVAKGDGTFDDIDSEIPF